jgi:hypothetical protein
LLTVRRHGRADESFIGLVVGACLSVSSLYALHRLQPHEADETMIEVAVRLPLSPHEQERFDAFGAMSLNDVRARAQEFESAQSQYAEWLKRRRARRGHGLDPDEQEGYAPEAQNGDRAKRWRALEQELRARGLWQVRELSEPERLRWAKRLVALSDLSRPKRRWMGPKPPRPEVRDLSD